MSFSESINRPHAAATGEGVGAKRLDDGSIQIGVTAGDETIHHVLPANVARSWALDIIRLSLSTTIEWSGMFQAETKFVSAIIASRASALQTVRAIMERYKGHDEARRMALTMALAGELATRIDSQKSRHEHVP